MDKRSEPQERESDRARRTGDSLQDRKSRSALDYESGTPFLEDPERDILRKGQPDPEKKKSDKGYVRAFANYSQIAFTIAAALLIGVLIGRFLDGLLGTSPWLLLLFSILGMGAALKSAFNISKK